MALRKPDLDSGGDYSTYEMRDLRDAVNEWIADMKIPIALVKRIVPVFDQLEDTISILAKRVEALEAKMVDNTPKGGYDLPYHNEKGKIIYPEGTK